MKLSELSAGSKACILRLDNLPLIARKKLMALGLLPHTEIQVLRFAPLGDPMQIRARGCDIALRLSLAQLIEVQG